MYKNSETTKVIMEQEKVIREEGILDEQIDVAWANTTAADLARRSSDYQNSSERLMALE